MRKLQILYHPEHPAEVSTLEAVIGEKDFSEKFAEHDRIFIDSLWADWKNAKGDLIFSSPGNLGTLFDIRGSLFLYQPTEFKVYLATSSSYPQKSLSPLIYDSLRTSVVGAAVFTADEKIFIQRRPETATHAPGFLDSSVAGFCHPSPDGKLSFLDALLEKLSRELHIREEEIASIALTGAHSSPYPDFSGSFAFKVSTSLESGSLKERINHYYIASHDFISPQELPGFILRHYALSQDMIGEGCAVLLSSLEYPLFQETVRRINKYERKIVFGTLKKGTFIEQPLSFSADERIP